MSRRFLSATLPLAVIVLLGGGFYLWVYQGHQFIPPTPGLYAGLVETPSNETLVLTVERLKDSPSLFVWLSEKGFSAVTRSIPPDGFQGPLSLQGGDRVVELVSKAQKNDNISGKVIESGRSQGRSFILSRLASRDTPIDGTVLTDTKAWLSAWHDFEQLEARSKKALESQRSAEAEVKKLTGFLTDGELLRGSAQKRLQQERAQLAQIQEKLLARQAEVKKLDRQVELTYRVTGMGRLVSLARESLEREGRWIDSMLRVAPADIPPEILDQAAKAERVLELEELVNSENQKIAALLHPEESVNLEDDAPQILEPEQP